MPSLARITANRANARHSTGPRTVEGKARSSRNRLTHGLCGAHTVLPDEDPAAYQFLLDSLLEEHDPVGPTETLLIAQMAQAQWKLQRIARIEAGLFSLPDPSPAQQNRPCEHAIAEGQPGAGLQPPVSRLQVPDPRLPSLACISRYESAAHRAFDRALANLLKLKSSRTLGPGAGGSLRAAAAAHLDHLIQTRLNAPMPRRDSNPIRTAPGPAATPAGSARLAGGESMPGESIPIPHAAPQPPDCAALRPVTAGDDSNPIAPSPRMPSDREALFADPSSPHAMASLGLDPDDLATLRRIQSYLRFEEQYPDT